jgi:carbon storage regulator
MLILTRKPGERIMIGQDIVIEVVEGSGHRIRLGISAPPEIPVYREEIFRRIDEEHSADASRECPGESPYFVECG